MQNELDIGLEENFGNVACMCLEINYPNSDSLKPSGAKSNTAPDFAWAANGSCVSFLYIFSESCQLSRNSINLQVT